MAQSQTDNMEFHRPTEEDQQTARDLSNFAMQRIRQTVADAMDVSGSAAPMTGFYLTGQAAEYFIEGMANYQFGTPNDVTPTNKANRVRTQGVLAVLMCLASGGSKEAKHILDIVGKGKSTPDGRELARMLSQLAL